MVAGAIFGVWLSMSNESAVRGEQIKHMQTGAQRRLLDIEHNENHVRLAERDIDGLIPVVKAIKQISDGNSLKLDALLLRCRVSNGGIVSGCDGKQQLNPN